MAKKTREQLIRILVKLFNFEEKLAIEFQSECFAALPGKLNEEELARAKNILDIIMIQTMEHASILSDTISKLYGESAK